jgi:hypothetical protein
MKRTKFAVCPQQHEYKIQRISLKHVVDNYSYVNLIISFSSNLEFLLVDKTEGEILNRL